MGNGMIWAFYMELSNHMWYDEYSSPLGWYMPKPYSPENENDFALWAEMADFLCERKFNTVLIDVGDAVKLRKHPEICAPNALSKAELDRILSKFRSKGITPVPKLNFSACHDAWLKEYGRMAGSDIYRRVCGEIIDEVCGLFGSPSLFHLGLDEEDLENQLNCDAVIIRSPELWLSDVNSLFKACERNGARPWIWGDGYVYHPDFFVENVSHDALVSTCCYGKMCDTPTDYFKKYLPSFEGLDRAGFEQVPLSSSLYKSYNTFQTLSHGKSKLDPARVAGYLTARWARTTREEEYALKLDAQRMYDARKKVYPETL
ncbi:MAG: hypothetical protein IJS65_02825 [Clostridia bacterium]|nr:hypothetical protein [Clostridia bacterium]